MAFEFRLPTQEELYSPTGREIGQLVERSMHGVTFLKGGAGSGKTTIALQRFIRLSLAKKHATLLTFQNLLVESLKRAIKQHYPDINTSRVLTFHKWHKEVVGRWPFGKVDSVGIDGHMKKIRCLRDELSIDESQDLNGRVFQVLPQYYQHTLITADSAQMIVKEGTPSDQIMAILENDYSDRLYCRTLYRNFRNTYEIYMFARQFLPKERYPKLWDDAILTLMGDRHSATPIVITFSTIEQRNADLKNRIEDSNGNVGVLASSIGEVDNFYGFLVAHQIKCTKFHSKDKVLGSEIENVLITTFNSSKGLEFDDVFIIDMACPPKVDIADMRRLWYVASTRPRARLFVYRSTSGRGSDVIRSSFASESFVEVDLDRSLGGKP